MDGNLTHDKNNDGEQPQSLWHKFRSMRQSDNRLVRIAGIIFHRAWRISAEATALVLGMGIIWIYGANYLTTHKEVDISFLSSNVSTWFASAFEGKQGNIDSIFLKWDALEDEVVLIAKGARVKDEDDNEIQFINNVSTSIDFTKALSGSFNPKVIDIDGGSVTWMKDVDGEIIAGLGTPETVGRFGVFLRQKPGQNSGSRRFSMGSLKGLRTRNSTLYVKDELANVYFRVEGARLELIENDLDYALNADGKLLSEVDAGQFAFETKFNDDFSDITLELSVNDFLLSEIAPKTGRFHELSDYAMPLNGEISFSAIPETGLDKVAVDIMAGSGPFELFGQSNTLNSAKLIASYDSTSQKIEFETVKIDSQKMRAIGKIGFSNVGTPKTSFRSPKVDMDLDLSALYIDLTEYFDAPFEYDHFTTQAAWMGELKKLEIDNFDIGRNQYNLFGKMALEFTESGKITSLSGDLQKGGEFSSDDFLAYWPTNFVTGARRWIFKAMKEGSFSELSSKFDLDAEALSGAPLRDDQLNVDFSVENAHVKYMDFMPPYLDGNAKGNLRGNQLDVFATGGSVGTMKVADGTVNIPVLRPKGGDFTIDVNGQGDIAEMLRIIDNKPFEYTSRYGVNPEDFAGAGTVNVNITRPLLEFFDLSRIRYDVTGEFSGASAPFALGEHALKNGNVTLTSDKNGLEIKGPIDLGPWRPVITINETFAMPRPPSKYKIQGEMDREVLDKFGLGLRQYFDGAIDVTIDAQGQGINIETANVSADLTNAHIQISTYNKAIGENANLTGTILRKNASEGMSLKDVAVTGPGLSIAGQIDLEADGRLNYLNFPNVVVEGVAEANVYVKPNDDASRLAIGLDGKYIDLSEFMADLLRPNAEPLGVPYELSADLETIIVKPDFILNDTFAKIVSDGEQTLEADVQGKVFGEEFSFLIKPDGDARLLDVHLPDAGKAIYAFSNNTRITGGDLKISGEMLSLDQGGGFVGNVRMDDFVIQKAPAFAQLLSFASLKGLFDTLSGSGVHFNELKMPVEYRRGRLKLSKARTSGSALGMTADGIINIADKTLDLDGVIVPSYTANSLLGDVPLIGDILVGKKGEGIFALSYTMKGTFEKTEIGVNPLSALTPGFLRGIFEPNRKKDDEVMAQASQELADEIEKIKEGVTEVIPDE